MLAASRRSPNTSSKPNRRRSERKPEVGAWNWDAAAVSASKRSTLLRRMVKGYLLLNRRRSVRNTVTPSRVAVRLSFDDGDLVLPFTVRTDLISTFGPRLSSNLSAKGGVKVTSNPSADGVENRSRPSSTSSRPGPCREFRAKKTCSGGICHAESSNVADRGVARRRGGDRRRSLVVDQDFSQRTPDVGARGARRRTHGGVRRTCSPRR